MSKAWLLLLLPMAAAVVARANATGLLVWLFCAGVATSGLLLEQKVLQLPEVLVLVGFLSLASRALAHYLGQAAPLFRRG